MNRTRVLALALVAAATLGGCRTSPVDSHSALPQYAVGGEAEALLIIHERERTIQTFNARADIRLTDSSGKSVVLDGAIVLERPGNLRLRLWKLGQAVLDLTANGDDAWVWIARDEASDARQLTRSMLLNWTQILLDSANPAYVRQSALDGEFLRTHVARGESTLVCQYRRDVLALSSVTLPDGQTPQTHISFSDYRVVDKNVWPMHLNISPTGNNSGQVDIYFKDTEINGELSPAAFKPPARAEKLK